MLLVVAYNMSEWRYFVRLLRSPRADILVMLCTFGLTVFVDLTVAIEVGVVPVSPAFHEPHVKSDRNTPYHPRTAGGL